MRELENRLMKHINLLVERYPSLESAKDDIIAAYLIMEECYEMVESCSWLAMAALQQMPNILSAN